MEITPTNTANLSSDVLFFLYQSLNYLFIELVLVYIYLNANLALICKFKLNQLIKPA